MKRTSNFFHILLLICSVFGADADEVKAVSVFEGDSVTLYPDQDIQGIYLLLWRFGDNSSTIAQFIDEEISYPNPTWIFRKRLKLNDTGSLTISNMRAKHSGLYNLQIDGKGKNEKMKFFITVYEPLPVLGAHKAEIKIVSVMEGDEVTLHTDLSELHGDELIVWRFGDEEMLLAKDDKETKSPRLYDTDERFRHRLELNEQTGSLIIKHTKGTDAGLYTVKISSNNNTLYNKYLVTVSVPGSGLSPGAVAGIAFVLLLFAVAAVLGFLYYRHKTSELLKQLDNIYHTAEGEDVTIQTETELHEDDEIQWWFRDDRTPIAVIKDGKILPYKGPNGSFINNRLELDKKTGSLTIKKIGRKHTGDYTIEINSSRGETTRRTFTALIIAKRIAVKQGGSETLQPDTEILRDDVIQWLFGDQLIAKMTRETRDISYPDERLRDRLELHKKTGSLTIKNITIKHTGDYIVKISSKRRRTKIEKFSLYFPPEEKILTVGETAVLQSGTEIQREDQVKWRFKSPKAPIAEIKDGQKTFPNAGPDEVFKIHWIWMRRLDL